MKTTSISEFQQKKFSRFLQINLALLVFLFLTAFQSHATYESTGTTINRYTGTSANVSIPSIVNSTNPSTIGTYQGDWYDLVDGQWVYNNTDAIGAFYCIDPDSDAYNISAIFVDGVKQSNVYLTTLSIPNTITTIEARTFTNTGLQSITFGTGLTSIGGSAFQNCNLTTLDFPESLETISFGAFAENPNLRSVYIPASVTNIGTYAFGVFDEANYKWSHPANLYIQGYEGTQAEVYALSHGIPFDNLTASEEEEEDNNSSTGTYSIKTSVTGGGSVSPNTTSSAPGEYISFSAIPNSNYRLGTYAVYTTAGQPVTVTYNAVMDRYYFLQPWSDVVIYVTFYYTPEDVPSPDGTYSIYTQPSSVGTLTLSHNTAQAGELITITVTTISDYSLTFLSAIAANGTVVELNNVGLGIYTFIQPASSVEICPTFTQNDSSNGSNPNPNPDATYAVTVNANPGGSLTASHSFAAPGDNVTLTATASSGYTLSSISAVNGSGMAVDLTNNGSGVYTYYQPWSNIYVNANFTYTGSGTAPTQYYSITKNTPVGGTVTLSQTSALQGDYITIQTTANTGYGLTTLTATNSSGGNVALTNLGSGRYAYYQPASNVSISASFTSTSGGTTDPEPDTSDKTYYNISAKAVGEGSFNISHTTAQGGTRVAVGFEAITGTLFHSVIVYDGSGNQIYGGIDVTSGEFVFIMPFSNTSVTVNFIEIPSSQHPVTLNTTVGGSYLIDNETPYSNDLVNIHLFPDTNYSTMMVAVRDQYGSKVDTVKRENGKYYFIQPATPVTITVTFVHTPEVVYKYSDLNTFDWYTPYIAKLYNNGYNLASTTSTFAPYEQVTRGAIAVILAEISGEYIPTVTTAPFSDVAVGQWYTNSIAWCKANGIITGYTDNTFGVAQTVTREQLATILYQFAQHKGLDTTVYNPGILAVYYDLPEISFYARDAMTWAVDYNLFTGYAQYISPQANTTRAELAAIMCAVFMEGYR